MKQTLYSSRCWVNGILQPASIGIENGKIAEIKIGEKLLSADVVDLGDAVLMPGVIDAHVHINEPGRTDWEGFDTATQAAAAGGITTLVDMPLNASPVTTTLAAFKEKLEASKGKMHVNCGFYAGIVPDNAAHLEALIEAGVLGVKAFLVHSGIDDFPHVERHTLEAAMPLFARHQVPLLAHCELLSEGHYDDNLQQNPTSYQAYLQSRPKRWENDAVQMMIELCRAYRAPVHIVHVSSAETLADIEQAKREGLPLTAETCPHYLYFCAEEVPDANTLYKCAPPIRERINNQALHQALRTGGLDFIATDHSPAPANLKHIETGNLQRAWGGIAGLQNLLSAAWTVLQKDTRLEEFIPLLTENPARFLGISDRKGMLKVGSDADLVVWSPETQFILQPEQILFKHKISPYIGKSFQGKVLRTYVNGALVFEGNTITHKNAGTWLFKK